MKQKFIIIACALVSFAAIARVIEPFHGWDRLKTESPNIAIVECGSPVPPNPNEQTEGAPKSDSNAQIIFTLKGTNETTSVRLQTDYELSAGRKYLVFGQIDKGVFLAYEKFRIIKIGRIFSIESITGKTLDEQVQVILERRLPDLNQELEQNIEEKQRLERKGIK